MYNLYDFDKTIYNGDSSIDFFLYSLKRNWSIIKYIPKDVIAIIKYKTKKISKKEMKEIFFSFLNEIHDIDIHIENFWHKHRRKIKKWYLLQEHSRDIIITASPDFLIKPMGTYLKVKDVIATKVDKTTGKFTSNNCYGEEKVKRLYEKYSKIKVNEAYSDSLSDIPMLKLATNQYLVKKDKITKINSK